MLQLRTPETSSSRLSTVSLFSPPWTTVGLNLKRLVSSSACSQRESKTAGTFPVEAKRSSSATLDFIISAESNEARCSFSTREVSRLWIAEIALAILLDSPESAATVEMSVGLP